MYSPKYCNARKRKHRPVLLLLSLVLLMAVTATGTIAFLAQESGPVTNLFTLTPVPNDVVESISGGVKSNVRIKNSSDTEAYIRASVVITWADGSGNVHHQKPSEADYELVMGNSENWIKRQAADGSVCYYYKQIVPAAGETDNLIDRVRLKETAAPPAGYKLSVEIMGQSIQANGVNSEGKKPVVLAWGLDPEDLQ